ncbi:MAG: 2-oxo acid dehydrogenase subunit E2 [Caldisericaceae bacterium]
MMFSLTFDHRVVDGALAAKFLGRIGCYLKNQKRFLNFENRRV